jgi:hypothetical protein
MIKENARSTKFKALQSDEHVTRLEGTTTLGDADRLKLTLSNNDSDMLMAQTSTMKETALVFIVR